MPLNMACAAQRYLLLFVRPLGSSARPSFPMLLPELNLERATPPARPDRSYHIGVGRQLFPGSGAMVLTTRRNASRIAEKACGEIYLACYLRRDWRPAHRQGRARSRSRPSALQVCRTGCVREWLARIGFRIGVTTATLGACNCISLSFNGSRRHSTE